MVQLFKFNCKKLNLHYTCITLSRQCINGNQKEKNPVVPFLEKKAAKLTIVFLLNINHTEEEFNTNVVWCEKTCLLYEPSTFSDCPLIIFRMSLNQY